MYYDLLNKVVGLVKIYEDEVANDRPDLTSFGTWFNNHQAKSKEVSKEEPDWQGKTNGRSADSMINTSLVHLYRYARLQAKTAIVSTPFATPDDFIYLITLTSAGSMTKSALIKANVHEKSVGIQIINRLIENGLAMQTLTDIDKRNRMIHITDKGTEALNQSMNNIRQASSNVTEPLTQVEKIDLIRLLAKLETFHELKVNNKSIAV